MSKPEHGDHQNKLNVVMIVNGTPYPMAFPLGQKLKGIVAETLAKTNNVGQPPENWELSHDGNMLDLDRHLRDYGFPEGVKLFLNPKAGQAGSPEKDV
jgi:hypothetical protein